MEVNESGGVWLPEDVIFTVLSWLPARPLCRFRCVCKGWRALISSAAFVAAQKSRAAPLLVGVFAAPSDEPEKHYDPLGFIVRKAAPEPDHQLRVMDADGNVLRVLSGVVRSSDELLPTRLDLVCLDRLGYSASVIDPATRRGVAVVRVHDNAKRINQMNRFGRAAPSGAYKIVRLHDDASMPEHARRQLCEVATLGDGGDGAAEPAWRQRPSPPLLTCWCSSCTVTVNGFAYFLHRGACGSLDLNCIASFDLEREEWKKIIVGPYLRYSKPWERWNIALGELKSTLCMVRNVRSFLHDPYPNTDIWLLVDAERSIWVKEYTIQLPDSSFMVKPLEVLRDGRLLLLKTIDQAQETSYTHILQLYTPSTGTFTDLKEMSKEFRGMTTLYTGSIL